MLRPEVELLIHNYVWPFFILNAKKMEISLNHIAYTDLQQYIYKDMKTKWLAQLLKQRTFYSMVNLFP